jgi:hypothetical protein
LLTRSGGTSGGATLEVAHEALLRQPPLSKWLEESEEFLIWRKRVARAREAFEANERGLLIGRELQIARDWVEAVPADEIATKDRSFIAESEAEDERIRAEDAARERERQAAELEAANARAEIAERDRQRQTAELEVAQARERAAKEVAEAARARERAVVETAEAARISEQAANAMAAVSRRIVQRTLAGLAVALALALVAFATGIYALSQQKYALSQQKEAVAGRNEALAARNQALAARNEALAAGNEALLNQSRLLADHSRQETDGNEPVTGVLLALEALPDTTSDDINIQSRPPWLRHGDPEGRPLFHAFEDEIDAIGVPLCHSA